MNENTTVSPTASNTQQSKNDDFYFSKYCRHVPRILRHQIVSKLVNQYMLKNDSNMDSNNYVSSFGDPGVDFKANTSIYRFHGALLFVDISGFTVLSQKLKVDELKNQINAYFQKIVDIIYKYDGEIVKFAGDALFIIWQTAVSDTVNNQEFHEAAKGVADKAVACGLEINLECGNYSIALKTSKTNSSKAKALIKSIENTKNSSFGPPERVRAVSNGSFASGSDKQRKRKRKEATVTYLNVHAGVSVGVMAGMDVGAQDRFEYLLLGQPMSDVAVAEGDAGQGEVVVSPEAHLLLHGPTDSSTGPAEAAAAQGKDGGANGINEVDPAEPALLLSCGCQRTPSGYFKLQSSLEDMLCTVDFSSQPPRDPAAGLAELVITEEEYEGNADLQFEFEVNAQVAEELMAGYKAIRPAIEAQFTGVMEKVTSPSSTDADTAAAGNPTAPDSPSKAVAEFAQREVAAEHFVTWAQRCLLDDIARHVHEVVRRDFAFHTESRDAPLDSFLASPACIEALRKELNHTHDDRSHHHHHRHGHRNSSAQTASSLSSGVSSSAYTSASVSSTSSSISAHTPSPSSSTTSRSHERSSFVSKMRQRTSLRTLRDKKKSRHQSVLHNDSSLVAELRSVIVLFISVKTGGASVFVDPTRLSAATTSTQVDSAVGGTAAVAAEVQTCKVDSFHFLRRTTAEIEADKRLVNMFQGCMEVMTEVFLAKGGQLRQFIVDDKGTVCIGTFGLRGSVNYDNAAAAVDAADLIIARIQALGFDASVGVTSGAAYCGLVGSSTRHEYAVMGPSTNLSARLMGRAAPGEILCDSAIRQRDRVHAYASLGAIKAKGYSKPVPIFKPEVGTPNRKDQLSLEFPDHSGGAVEIDSSMAEVFGRDQEARHVLGFLFQDSVKGSLQTLWDTFWLPAVQEPADLLSDKLFALPSAELEVKATSSSKKKLPQLALSEQRGRFDITQPSKEAVVAAANGMGKTAFLNLMQVKLNRLVAKNPEIYNLAVFRHQVGVVNATTVFSGWFCLVQQTLFSIAVYLAAETADPLATERLDALKSNDFRPIVDFLVAYLPIELQPYVSLLSNVGISLTPTSPTSAVTAGVDDTVENSEQQGAEPEQASPPGSGKTDPIAALDPADRMQRCIELIVGIAQLHVTIVRKVTVYIMDDLHQHDELSQKLGEHLASSTQGICLLCTITSSSSSSKARALSQISPLADPYSSFTKTLLRPTCSVFLRTELQPISQDICSALVSRIFAESGVVGEDEAVLAKLHSMSAGSPMYATELAKIVCHSYINREECNAQQQEQRVASCGAQLMDIIDKLRADRIEEVVHFRFDKLPEQCQLVLKMAAVAGLNGSHFTLPMLAFILDSSDRSESTKLGEIIHDTKALLGYLSDPGDGALSDDEPAGLVISSVDLAQALSELLESDAFIECREPQTSSAGSVAAEVSKSDVQQLLLTTLPSSSPDLTRLLNEEEGPGQGGRPERSHLRFHWKADVELRAIYDLMLGEQKESLHDRVASFLEQELARSGSNTDDGTAKATVTATEWSELGFHWERATAWGAAMTCYYRAAMLLRAQGDARGSKVYLSTAFRMLDAMSQDADVQSLQSNHIFRARSPKRLSPRLACDALTAQLAKETISEVDLAALMAENAAYLLSGRNVVLRAADLHRMFEKSSELLYTGLSVAVRMAQALLSQDTADIAYHLYENALDMVHLMRWDQGQMVDVDGGTFALRNMDVCFQVFSGIFLLHLNGQAPEVGFERFRRMWTVVALAAELAKSSPDFEAHKIMALHNKAKLMESCLLSAPQLAEQIVACTDDIHRMYQRDKHSQQLIYFYNSDRVASGASVAAKVLCLQGRFAAMHTHLEYAHQQSAKIKHFFSYASGTIGVYSIYLCYLPDVWAQQIYKDLQRKHQLARTEDFRMAVPLFEEGIAQYTRFVQYRATGEENVFDSDSAFVEELLQSRQLVQDMQDNHSMHLARIYHTGLELIAARICFLKALRFDLQYARDRSDKAASLLLLSYAKLGLLHLTFTATQRAKNETLVFANLHEKLLRAQLQLLVLKYSAEAPLDATAAAREGAPAVDESHEEALRDLRYCRDVALRGGYHTVLLQAGVLMQQLASLVLTTSNMSDGAVDIHRVSIEGAELQSNAVRCLREGNSGDAEWVGMCAAALAVSEEALLDGINEALYD